MIYQNQLTSFTHGQPVEVYGPEQGFLSRGHVSTLPYQGSRTVAHELRDSLLVHFDNGTSQWIPLDRIHHE